MSGWLDTFFGGIKDNIQSFLTNFLSWFNPMSDNFFLKVAFVPSSTFWNSYTSDWSDMWHTKFGVFYQIHDTFQAMLDSANANVFGWSGVQIDLSHYGAGKVDIINSDAINYYSTKIKFWFGGFIYFMFAGWFIKKIAGLVGEGK